MSHQLVHDSPEAPAPPRTEVAHLAAHEAVPQSGPAAAAVLAAGLAAFTLGLLSALTAASAGVSSALTLSERVGDLSGVTVATVIVFFASWAALAFAWRRSDPSLVRVAIGTAVLVALGLVGTFPPFFNAIG